MMSSKAFTIDAAEPGGPRQPPDGAPAPVPPRDPTEPSVPPIEEPGPEPERLPDEVPLPNPDERPAPVVL